MSPLRYEINILFFVPPPEAIIFYELLLDLIYLDPSIKIVLLKTIIIFIQIIIQQKFMSHQKISPMENYRKFQNNPTHFEL